MHSSSRTLLAAIALCLLAIAPRAHADDAELAAAREHFARGYTFAQSGNAEAAIGEFEQAYAASPKASVLYNLGQAYAAAGRSSEAIDALERFLKLSGPTIDEARLRQVQALIRYHAERVGKLAIEIAPAEAELFVDGRALGKGSHTVSLNAGSHHVSASAPGFEPTSLPVLIAAGASKPLELHLTPLPSPAQLSIRCHIDGVRVVIDEVARGQTPSFSGGPLASGSHRVRFERPGYVTDARSLELSAGETRVLTCELRGDPHDSSSGRVTVEHPEGTQVFLDDEPYRGSWVPAGPHRLRVSGAGYASETRAITLEPRGALHVSLLPPRDAQALADERERARRTRRIAAYVLGGVSAATAISAGAIYLYNNQRYSDWQAKSRNSVRTLASDPNAPVSLDALLAEENQIRRRDSWALGLSVLSGAALATSAVLFFGSRESEPRLVITAGAQPSLRYQHSF